MHVLKSPPIVGTRSGASAVLSPKPDTPLGVPTGRIIERIFNVTLAYYTALTLNPSLTHPLSASKDVGNV